MLDLGNPEERATHDFIRRISSGRWPTWRLLGMRRCRDVLNVAVEWCRCRSAKPYSVVYVSLKEPEYSWHCFSTAAEARNALARLDVNNSQPAAAAGE